MERKRGLELSVEKMCFFPNSLTTNAPTLARPISVTFSGGNQFLPMQQQQVF
jgi:hypothetical protein